MAEMKDEYDFSDYPKEHFLHDEANKKVIGKFKDECASIPISEYIGWWLSAVYVVFPA